MACRPKTRVEATAAEAKIAEHKISDRIIRRSTRSSAPIRSSDARRKQSSACLPDSSGTLPSASRPDSVMSRVSGSSRIDLVQVGTGHSEIAPAASDKRFGDPALRRIRSTSRVMQSYLAWRSSMHDLVRRTRHRRLERRRAMRFATMLITEALAPTNTLAGNPAALKHVSIPAGMSLVRGLRNFFERCH